MAARILIVEDEMIVSLELTERLKVLGYEVTDTVSSGEEALKSIGETFPDLVILDIMLAGKMDGIETAEIIKEKFHIPTIFLTAYADKQTLDRAKIATPYGYIIKPFEERELHTNIEIALYKHKTDLLLREKDKWLTTILYSMGEGVIATDLEGKISFMNEKASKITGFSIKEAAGRPVSEILLMKIKRFDTGLLGGYSEKPEGFEEEVLLISKAGEEKYIREMVTPIIDDNKRIQGTVIVIQDISREKRIEIRLKNSERKFKALVEKSPEMIFLYSTIKGGIYYSPKVNEILGYSLEKLRTDPWMFMENILPEDRPKIVQLYNSAGEGENFIHEYRIKDERGKVRWILEHAVCLTVSGDEKIIEGICNDITLTKQAEEKIHIQSSALNSAYNGIIIADLSGNIVWCNESIEKLSGYKKEEIIGNNPRLFQSGKQDEKFYQDLWQIIKNGKVWRSEIINRRKNGKEYYEEMSITPVKSKEGEITHFVAIKEDITERKTIEMKLIRAKEEAIRSDHLKSEFLAQMSHEIRTPINNILSSTQLLKSEMIELVDNEYRETFNIIERGGRRLIRTIDLILDMSAIQTNSYKVVKKKLYLLDDILLPLLPEFKNAAKLKNLSFSFCSESKGNLMVWADRYSLTQIFVNLIDNAVKYTEKGEISLSVKEAAKAHIVVKVSDTGIGISKEYINDIFKPFSQEEQGYTRKFEGTGLGLALVKNYCGMNDASIKVESKKNKGTIFCVTLKKLDDI